MEWERVNDGWANRREGKINAGGITALHSSKLELTLKDDATAGLTLTETYRSGDGCVFELDGGDYLKNTRACPRVLSAKPFRASNPITSRAGAPGAAAEATADNKVTTEDGYIIIDGFKMPVNAQNGHLLRKGLLPGQ